MKFTLRDLCWLLLVSAVGLGWLVHARRSGPAVQEGDLILVVSPVKIGPEQDFFLTRCIVHTVTANEFRIDHQSPSGLNGIAIDASGQFLGVTIQNKSGIGKVRRVRLPK